MDQRLSDDSAERFSAYLDGLSSVIGHAARIAPLRDYCSGPLLPGERKSVDLRIPVTEEQKELVVQAAKADGQDMASWARSLLISSATKSMARASKSN